MNCRQFIEYLDDYLDGTLSEGERQSAGAHASACGGCQRRLARRHALRAALREMPVPAASPDFSGTLLHRMHQARTRWRRPAVGAALAAGLALWFAFGWLPDSMRSSDKLASVTITLAEPRMVQIAFTADHALAQAMLDIKLPEGVELQGYPGQRQIRWQTDLAQGVNILSLPLIATTSSGGVLLARLEHGERSTELAVQLRVNDRVRSGVSNLKRGRHARV